jgi:8-oxo-dGTP diphosphatase
MSEGARSERRPGVGVGVLVFRDDQLLMVRRKHHGAGTWAAPGGYLDSGESPEECAAREVREEVGIALTNIVYRGITNDIHPDGKHNVTIWLSARAGAGEAHVAAPDELTDVGWFSPDALPRPIYRSTENVLQARSLPADAYKVAVAAHD